MTFDTDVDCLGRVMVRCNSNIRSTVFGPSGSTNRRHASKPFPGVALLNCARSLLTAGMFKIEVTPYVPAELRRAIFRHEPAVDHVVDVAGRDGVRAKALDVLKQHLELTRFGYEIIPVRLCPSELSID